jgi:hypothetical protein
MSITLCLTTKEQALYDAIEEGMDAPGSGWLHELANETLSTAGVLGSLVKKGLVLSIPVREPGYPTAYWVELIRE